MRRKPIDRVMGTLNLDLKMESPSGVGRAQIAGRLGKGPAGNSREQQGAAGNNREMRTVKLETGVAGPSAATSWPARRERGPLYVGRCDREHCGIGTWKTVLSLSRPGAEPMGSPCACGDERRVMPHQRPLGIRNSVSQAAHQPAAPASTSQHQPAPALPEQETQETQTLLYLCLQRGRTSAGEKDAVFP